jgi:hypothetical protein
MAGKADDVPHVVRDPSTGRVLSCDNVIKLNHLVAVPLGPHKANVYQDPSGKLWYVRSLSGDNNTGRTFR